MGSCLQEYLQVGTVGVGDVVLLDTVAPIAMVPVVGAQAGEGKDHAVHCYPVFEGPQEHCFEVHCGVVELHPFVLLVVVRKEPEIPGC